MRRYFIIATFLLFAPSVALAFTANSSLSLPPNNLGLVGYWTFDGANMTQNVADSSGQGNTGYITGYTSTTTTQGKVGQALSFNGTTNTVLVQPSAISSLFSVTMSVWVYPTSPDGYIAAISNNTSGFADEMDLSNSSPCGSNTVEFAASSGADHSHCATGIQLNQWNFIVGTYDLASQVENIYVNGVLSASRTDAYSGGFAHSGYPLYIGSLADTLGFFSGKMDDLRLYNRALTQTQVTQLYNSAVGSHQNASLNPPNLAKGLVGWWTLDGANMTQNVADSSGSGNNGHLVGFTSTTTVLGKIGQALSFNGNQDASVGSSLGFSGNTNITVVGWAYRAAAGDHGAFFKLGNATDAGGGDGFAIGVTNGGTTGFETSGNTLSALYEGVRWVNTSQNFGTGWHQFALVIDGSGFPTIYYDGASVYNDTTGAPLAIGSKGTSIAQIGGYTSSVPSNRFFKGSLDDVRVYSRALSASEIAQLYNLAVGSHQNATVNPPNLNNGLVGHWTFDGGDMTSNVKDSSGGGHNGFLAGFTSTTSSIGKIGQALSFNSALTQYVNIDTVAPVSDFTTPFTFSAWFKTNSFATNGAILEEANTGNSSIYAGMVLGGTGNHFLRCNLESQFSNFDIVGSTQLSVNTWYLATLVISGTTATCYLNAGSQGSSGTDSPISFNTLRIGELNRGIGNENLFNGSIDDVRIYNRALSASEIKQLYNVGH